MYFRKRGNRVNVMKYVFNKSKKKTHQSILLSFSTDVRSIDVFTEHDLRKLDAQDREELKLWFEKSRRLVDELVGLIQEIKEAIEDDEFEDNVQIHRLKASIDMLKNVIEELPND